MPSSVSMTGYFENVPNVTWFTFEEYYGEHDTCICTDSASFRSQNRWFHLQTVFKIVQTEGSALSHYIIYRLYHIVDDKM